MSAISQYLEVILSNKGLSALQATELMTMMLSGEASTTEIAAVLVAFRSRPVTSNELTIFAEIMRSHAEKIDLGMSHLVDTCGTGGGIPSFNLSTGAMFIAAAAGVPIAKHGNRAVTSKCGSADVLEALGARVDLGPGQVRDVFDATGMAFMYAQNHHPAMAAVREARLTIGIRTIFNQLGPLTNPAGADRQLIGVYDKSFLHPMTEALKALGSKRAFVVLGHDGLDEISPIAPTHYCALDNGQIEQGDLHPSEFGIGFDSINIAPGNSAIENALILRSGVYGHSVERTNALIPNAAMAIWLADRAKSWGEAADKAREAVQSGKAAAKLDRYIDVTQRV